MGDRFPTSADLRDSAAQHRHLSAHFRDRDDLDARQAESYAAPHDARAARLLALADALDAGARIVEAGPARTCGWCAHDLGGHCAPFDADPRVTNWGNDWCGTDGRPLPTATPCPGFAPKVTP